MIFETDVDLRIVTFDNGVMVTFSTLMAANLIGASGPIWQSDIRQALNAVFDQAELTEVEIESVITHLLT